ncbi:UbiA family prenyltransferase [Streptomyces xiamenensis]
MMAIPVLADRMRDRVRALYGFSRGTQASLSVAQPLIGALIAVPNPPLDRLGVALVAAFAGYFALFAVNDLLDHRLDRKRFAHLRSYEGFDIDSTGVRHPLAQGRLSYPGAVTWVVTLGGLALVLAAWLHWLCAVLFVVAALLQVVYCALATVTPHKFWLTGACVGVAACAGWFALAPVTAGGGGIDWPRLLLFFCWMAAWEIGGRNLVNDWADVEEDVHLGVRTVPVVYGHRVTARLVLAFLLVTFGCGVALMIAGWSSFRAIGVVGTVLAGCWALLVPGLALHRDPRPETALAVFNRASLYPVLVLVVILLAMARPE